MVIKFFEKLPLRILECENFHRPPNCNIRLEQQKYQQQNEKMESHSRRIQLRTQV